MATSEDFLSRILPECAGCSNFIAEQALHDTILDFCSTTKIITKAFSETILSTDIDSSENDSVDIDVSEAGDDLRPVTVCAMEDGTTSFIMEYKEATNDIALSDLGTEYKYFFFPEPNIIRIFPVSSACTMYLEVAFKPTQDADVYPDILHEDWVDAIAYGTKERLMRMQNNAWTNLDMSIYYRKLYRTEISLAKSKMRKKYTNRSSTIQYKSFGNID